MYKDKDKQREANKKANKRYRQRKQGITPERGITVSQEAMVIPDHPVPVIPKRGKDIKCFEDLPLDVQQVIDKMSINKDGTVNQIVKANRTVIAINYQHLWTHLTHRYYSTGAAI